MFWVHTIPTSSYNPNITWNLWTSHPLPRQSRGLAHGPGKVQRLRQARPFSHNEAEFFFLNEKKLEGRKYFNVKNFTRVVQGADSLISSEDAINGYIRYRHNVWYSIVWYCKILSCLLAANCYRLTVLRKRSVFLVDDSLQGTSGEAAVASWRVKKVVPTKSFLCFAWRYRTIRVFRASPLSQFVHIAALSTCPIFSLSVWHSHRFDPTWE